MGTHGAHFKFTLGGTTIVMRLKNPHEDAYFNQLFPMAWMLGVKPKVC